MKRINYKRQQQQQYQYTNFRDNFYSMPEGNTCITEPKLEVLQE